MKSMLKAGENVSRVEKRELQFADAHIEGNSLFFSARNMNGLFRYKIGESKTEFLGHFKDEIIWQRTLHRQVINVENYLYFIPYNGQGISIYNKQTQTFSFVKIKERNLISVSRAFLLGQKIYMIPSDLDTPWIVFDIDSHNYEIAWDLWKSILSRFSNKADFIRGVYDSCIHENKLFLKGEKGVIICVDLERKKVHTYKIPESYNIRNLFFDKDICYFILSNKFEVVRWDWSTNTCQEYKIKDMPAIKHPYMCMLRWGKHLLLLPDQMDDIWELDEKENKWHVEKKYIPNGFCRERKKGSLFLGYGFLEDKLLLFPWMGNGMIMLTETESKLQKIYYSDEVAEENEKIQKQFLQEQIFSGVSLIENSDEEIELKDLLSVVLNISKEAIYQNENKGKKIWSVCR